MELRREIKKKMKGIKILKALQKSYKIEPKTVAIMENREGPQQPEVKQR